MQFPQVFLWAPQLPAVWIACGMPAMQIVYYFFHFHPIDRAVWFERHSQIPYCTPQQYVSLSKQVFSMKLIYEHSMEWSSGTQHNYE